MDFPSVSKRIEAFISKNVKDSGCGGIVLGLSGGVDSAVVAALSAKAIGPDNVLGVIMPASTSSPSDMEDAMLIAEKLHIATSVVPLKSIIEAFCVNLHPDMHPSYHHGCSDKRSLGNLTARVRMCLLYYYANKMDYLVAGTGNKSELSIGYFTKYGDGGCDLLPIGDLYKTQVWELARFLDLPKKVIERVPTAGLWPGQTDEGELGISYKELDVALSGGKLDVKVQKMVNKAEHKRKPPEVCKIQ